MGGASTQITFVPSKPAPHSSKLKLYGTEYQLYTHSYLCYGKKEAERRFLAQLVKVNLFVWVPFNFSIFTLTCQWPGRRSVRSRKLHHLFTCLHERI